MTSIAIRIGREFSFAATLEVERAPRTCEAFLRLLPIARQIIHARWSGEAMWVPLGKGTFLNAGENLTSHPAPGQLLWYPGGISEPEILVPYGAAIFSSRVGLLPGTHFLTVTTDISRLQAAGETTLWKGAQDVTFAIPV